MSRLVIRTDLPRRQRFLRLVFALAVTLAIARGLFYYGYRSVGIDLSEFEQRIGAQAEQILQLEDDNNALRNQLAITERSREIEQEAYRRLEGTVAELQDERLELKEELAFYRGIVSPLDGRRGLTLQDFILTPGDGPNEYHYKVVLTQVLKNDRVIRGKVKLILNGRRDGENHRLGLAQLHGDGKDSLAFHFKYFQNLEGTLRLPQGFEPLTVEVKVDPSGKVRKKLVKVFDWPL